MTTWQRESDPIKPWPEPSQASCFARDKILPVGPQSPRPLVTPRSGPVPSLPSLPPATGLFPDPQTRPAQNVLSPSHTTQTLLHSDLCSRITSRSPTQLPAPLKTSPSILPGSSLLDLFFSTAFNPTRPYTADFSYCSISYYIRYLSD